MTLDCLSRLRPGPPLRPLASLHTQRWRSRRRRWCIVCANHALVDGNKRLALGSLIVFLGINGHRLTWSNDEAYGFIMAIAAGELTDVPTIGLRIREATDPI